MLSDDIRVDILQGYANELNIKDKIKFKDILPTEYKVKTYEEMLQLGWFNNEN